MPKHSGHPNHITDSSAPNSMASSLMPPNDSPITSASQPGILRPAAQPSSTFMTSSSQSLPLVGSNENGGAIDLNGGDNGEFKCKSCLRGPPLTKKYAKNQCQTCYKKEKKQ